MIRAFAILHRRPDVSEEEFIRYWKEVHAPIVLQVPGIRRFREHRVVGCNIPGIEPFVAGELWFDSPEALFEGFASENGKKAYASGANIIDQARNVRLILEEIADFQVEGTGAAGD
jgi:uncharacterized protein (TIGR02118 family)